MVVDKELDVRLKEISARLDRILELLGEGRAGLEGWAPPKEGEWAVPDTTAGPYCLDCETAWIPITSRRLT